MKKILGAVSLLVLCGMLIAGLWPFNFFPRNDVAWLKNSNGLQFGDRARVYSSRNRGPRLKGRFVLQPRVVATARWRVPERPCDHSFVYRPGQSAAIPGKAKPGYSASKARCPRSGEPSANLVRRC